MDNHFSKIGQKAKFNYNLLWRWCNNYNDHMHANLNNEHFIDVKIKTLKK